MNPLGPSCLNYKSVSRNPTEIEKNKIITENKKVIKEFKQSTSALESKYRYGWRSFQGHKVDLENAVGKKYLKAIRTISKNAGSCDREKTIKNLTEITTEIDRIDNLSQRIEHFPILKRKFKSLITKWYNTLIETESIAPNTTTADFFSKSEGRYINVTFKNCAKLVKHYRTFQE